MLDWVLRWEVVGAAAGVAAGLASGALVRHWRLKRLIREMEAAAGPAPRWVGERCLPIQIGEMGWLGSARTVWRPGQLFVEARLPMRLADCDVMVLLDPPRLVLRDKEGQTAYPVDFPGYPDIEPWAATLLPDGTLRVILVASDLEA